MTLKLPRMPPFIASLVAPLGMTTKRFSRCFRFLFLNLIFGLLGVYVALLAPFFFANYSFAAQLDASLKAGDFYTFTIAFLSSTAVLLLESQPRHPDAGVARLKPTLVLIILALVVFSAVGAVMQVWLATTQAPPAASAPIFQTRLFWVGVAVAFYCFLVAIYEEELDDFASEDNARRAELTRHASSADSDGRGIAV